MSKVDIDELVRWRNQCEAFAASLKRKMRHCDEITEERDKALSQRDEARAEVERLTAQHLERHLESWEQYMEDNDIKRAYRRGAEAMRDAAANALDMAGQGTLCDTSACEHWGRYVRALPIPEEP